MRRRPIILTHCGVVPRGSNSTRLCRGHNIFVSSCEQNRQAPTPAGERGIAPGSNGRRPVRWCSSRTSVAARLSCANDGQGDARNLPIPPVASGGDRTARTLPSYRGDWLPCQTRAPIAPAPDVRRHLQRSLPASTGRQAGEENEALTASAPVAGERITNMVCFGRYYTSRTRSNLLEPPGRLAVVEALPLIWALVVCGQLAPQHLALPKGGAK